MAITTPPTITPGPTPPQRNDKSTFSNRVDAFVTWLIAVVSQFAAVATNVYNNALEAFGYATAASNSATAASTSAQNAADSAAAAAVTTGATLWVSGQTVAQDAAKISPLDRRTYRRRTSTGSGTTDPSLDSANYVLLSADATSSHLLGTATVGSAVVNIDFLNIFSSKYDCYQIKVKGLTANSAGGNTMDLNLRLAVSGAATGAIVGIVPGLLPNALGVSGSVELINVRTAGKMQSANVAMVHHRFDGQVVSLVSAAVFTSQVVASGLRLYLSDGTTFSGGSVEIHGIKNS